MPSQATRPPLAGLPAVWLRDNCPCPLCRAPVSGQRLLHITDIPADVAVAEVVPSPGTVSVLFHPDGHRAVFDRDWLDRYGGPARGGPPDPRTEDAKRLWSVADLAGEPPRGSWPRYLAEAGYRRTCQSAILREGLLVLVPTVQLRPGDCAVFDNTRVLHARTGFTHGGRRHLQGCYADLDGVESAVAVGDRPTTGVTCRKDRT